MQHLSEFMASYDFIYAKPDTGWITISSGHLLASGLSNSGHDYIAYLADQRELSDSHAGEPIMGRVSLELPPGEYDVSLYSPSSGEYSPAIRVTGGAQYAMKLQEFKQDIVIRARLQDR